MSNIRSAIATVAIVLTLASASTGAVAQSAPINPYSALGQTRTELAAAYPELSRQELDGLVFRVADVGSMARGQRADLVGSWSCVFDGAKHAVLSVRTHSYTLHQTERTMSGEYGVVRDVLTVHGGPLAGMGVAGGTIDAMQSPRRIALHGERGLAAMCIEVL